MLLKVNLCWDAWTNSVTTWVSGKGKLHPLLNDKEKRKNGTAKVEVTNTNSFPLFSSQARAICDREVSSRLAYLYCKLQTRKSINQLFCFLITYWTRLSWNPLKVFPFCFRISMAWKLRRPWNSFSPAALKHVSTSNFKDLCLLKHGFKFLRKMMCSFIHVICSSTQNLSKHSIQDFPEQQKSTPTSEK